MKIRAHGDPTNFELVGDFMEAFGQEVNCEPTLRDQDTQDLRIDLIQEELDELALGIDNNDIVEVADALTDLLYVVYGAGHAFGIDLDAFQHTAIEAGVDTATLALHTSLILNIGPATIGAEDKTIHTWICYDKQYYFNADGSVSMSE